MRASDISQDEKVARADWGGEVDIVRRIGWSLLSAFLMLMNGRMLVWSLSKSRILNKSLVQVPVRDQERRSSDPSQSEISVTYHLWVINVVLCF